MAGSGGFFLMQVNGRIASRIEHEYPLGTPFETLEAALQVVVEVAEDLNEEKDQIMIWEVDADGPHRLAWHYTGWDWGNDWTDSLPQGKLPGHEDSLYAEVMERFGLGPESEDEPF